MWSSVAARRHTSAALSLLALAPVLLISCKNSPSPGAVDSNATPAASEDGPIVTINSVPITKDQFVHRLETVAGARVLQALVNEELWIQLAKKEGVVPPDATVDAKFDQMSKQVGFQESLRQSHQTVDDVKRSILANLSQQAVISKGVTVTDKDVRAFYDANADPRNPRARYYQPETVSVQIIATDKPGDIAKAKHDLAGGATFESVARAYSKDRSKADGGLLPPVKRGQLSASKFPGLEQKIFNMTNGQVIDNVRVAGAYWIIRCVNHRPQRKVPFDQVKDECRTGAQLSKGLKTNARDIQSALNDFKKQADIKTLWPQYKDVIQGR